MNVRQWAASLPDEFWKWGTINSVPYELRRYTDVLKSVQAMTTPSNMHLLNLAVQCMPPNECYLEVGTWRGGTLIGALLGNAAYGRAIDNDTMDEHDGDKRSSRDVWSENIERFGMSERALYINDSVPGVWQGFEIYGGLIGVYLFDGDKSTDAAAFAGLDGVLPFLADEALIIVDDANELNIRLAVKKFERAHPNQLTLILDIPTPGNCWPQWWNGVMALAYRRA